MTDPKAALRRVRQKREYRGLVQECESYIAALEDEIARFRDRKTYFLEQIGALDAIDAYDNALDASTPNLLVGRPA